MAPPPATKSNTASLEGVPQAKQTVPTKAPPPPQCSPEAYSMNPPPAKVPRIDRGDANLLVSSSTQPPAQAGGKDAGSGPPEAWKPSL
eukprot:100721-Pyramimonas_sp.AAC.1